MLSDNTTSFTSLVSEVCVNFTASVDVSVEESELLAIILNSEDPAVNIVNSTIQVTVLDISTGEIVAVCEYAISTICMHAGLAEFQFVDGPILKLELLGSVAVCIELIPPTTILEKDVYVVLTTVDGTASGQ